MNPSNLMEFEKEVSKKTVYFEKGKTYRIVDQSADHVSIYQPDIERGVFCLWKGCSFLSAGLVWIPVYEGQMEFQFE